MIAAGFIEMLLSQKAISWTAPTLPRIINFGVSDLIWINGEALSISFRARASLIPRGLRPWAVSSLSGFPAWRLRKRTRRCLPVDNPVCAA